MKVSIEEFVTRLAEFPEEAFEGPAILDFLRRNPVDPSTLGPYLYFSDEHYTRNLIHRTRHYELLAICWDIGQKSAIHNHRDQRCWMAAPYGRLEVHNYKVIRRDSSSGSCELEPDNDFVIDPESPGEVDPDEPVHQVLNPASFGSRAVTLHIYSRPFDSCEVYDLHRNSYLDVQIANTSEFGVLRAGLNLERIRL